MLEKGGDRDVKALAWLSGFVTCLSFWAAKHCPAHPASTAIGLVIAIILGVIATKKK